jgi:hypothetical protein
MQEPTALITSRISDDPDPDFEDKWLDIYLDDLSAQLLTDSLAVKSRTQ